MPPSGNLSSSEDVSYGNEYQQHHVATIITFCLIYGMISLSAFLGNVMVIWIICKSKFLSPLYKLGLGYACELGSNIFENEVPEEVDF